MHSQKYILLVEDCEADIRMFLFLLKQQGFPGRVEVLKDGREALEFLSLSALLPVAIIVDACLPGLSGIEVIRHIKVQPGACHVPVVVWSSAEYARDREACEGLSGVRYLPKPFDLCEWEQQVDQFMCEWAQIEAGG